MMRSDDFDFAIIGGGIQGMYTALLASLKMPDLSIAIFDKGRVGSGASKYSPGIQLAYGRSFSEREFSKSGQLAWDEMFARWNWRSGKVLRVNWITNNPDLVRQSATEYLQQSTADLPFSLSGFRDALHAVEGTCSYDPVAPIIERIKSEVISRGVEIFENTDIVNIDSVNTGLKLIDGAASSFECQRAVVALGPWIARSPLAALCSELAEVKIKKVVALLLDIEPLSTDTAIALSDDYAFLMPMFEEGKWLFSFSSDDWGSDPDGDFTLSLVDVDKATDILNSYALPAVFDVASTRIFCDAYTANGLPIVHPSDRDGRISFIAGGGGNGFRFAPPIAEKALASLFPAQLSGLASND